MSELVYEAGLTIKIPGKEQFNMAKPIVRFTIDSDGDVDEQIAVHVAAMKKVAPAVEDCLAQELANISGLSVKGAGQGAAISELEQMMGFAIKEQKRVKKLLLAAGIDKPAPKKRGRPKKEDA